MADPYLIAQLLNTEGHYVHHQVVRTPRNPNESNIEQGQIPTSTLSHLLAGRLPGARAFLNHMADPYLIAQDRTPRYPNESNIEQGQIPTLPCRIF